MAVHYFAIGGTKKKPAVKPENALIITTILLWTILNNAKHFN